LPQLEVHDVQARFIECRDRFTAYIGGIGSGKTYAGAIKAGMHCQPRTTGLVVAPCYHPSTEVLTEKRGWVLFPNLQSDDRVATLKNGKTLEYQAPLQVFDFPYDGELLYVSSQEIDLAVTPNHRCWVSFKHNGFGIRTAEEIYGKWDYRFAKTAEWETEPICETEDWYEFLGFWFAEGYAESSKRKNRVVVTQKKFCEYTDDLMARNFPKFSKDARTGGGFNYTVYGKEIAKMFVRYGKARTKAVPYWIKAAPASYLRAFLKGYIAGDGHSKKGKHDQIQMWTASKQLADDLQEIAFKAGYSANLSQHNRGMYYVCIRTAKKNNPSPNPEHWHKEHYTGRVHCVQVPNGIIYVRRNGKPVWCGNTYPMLRDATMKTFMDLIGPPAQLNRTEMKISLPGNAEILFRSAENPDRLRGPNIHWAWIDEAAMCDPFTWDIVIGRLRADGKAGPCWVTSTPKGRNWLYYKLDQMTVFRSKTMDNPYLAKEFVLSLQDAYSGLFADQELNAEFVSFEGLVYHLFNRELHVRDRNPSEMQRWFLGVDEGFTNPAVLLVVGVDGDGRLHVADEWYQRQQLQEAQVKAAAALKERYPFEAVYVDRSAPGLVGALRKAGLPVKEHYSKVLEGIREVQNYIATAGDGRPRLTVSPNCANTLTEFESYVWKTRDRGGHSVNVDEPEKVNDHALDALRYVVCALRQPQYKKLEVGKPQFMGGR